jgi:leucyl aminopeptidase (aminopeptidase T)
MNNNLLRNARIIIRTCGQVKFGERVLIITDSSTEKIGKYLFNAANKATPYVVCIKTRKEKIHGIEPSETVAKAMEVADVIFAATQSSLAHTRARRNATTNGARYLSLADYSTEQLASSSLRVDFFKQAKLGKILQKILTNAKEIVVKTESGTDLRLHARGRVANYCPGFCDKPGMLGSPPDIETNISPVEASSEGVLVVDGSIPCRQIGLLEQNITIIVAAGLITKIDTSAKQGKSLEKLLDIKSNFKRGILAEFGIGLNPKAKLLGFMLEDEGCLGTVHFGFGSNATVGGKNDVNFHLDTVISKPNVFVNNIQIMKNGIFLSSIKS